MLILSKEEARRFSQFTDLTGWRVVSILDPGARQVYLGGNQITVWFHDITEPMPDLKEPSEEIVFKILDECKKDEKGTKTLVHCTAGISRSTAIAWGILIAKGRDPLGAAKHIMQVRPIALPNMLIVSMVCHKYKVSNPFEGVDVWSL